MYHEFVSNSGGVDFDPISTGKLPVTGLAINHRPLAGGCRVFSYKRQRSVCCPFLFCLAYPDTIGVAPFGVAVVTGIVNTTSAISARPACNPAARLFLWHLAFTGVIDGNACSSCVTGIGISLAVATANRLKYVRAYLRFGLAGTLCIRCFALPGTEIAVLLCVRTLLPPDSATD